MKEPKVKFLTPVKNTGSNELPYTIRETMDVIDFFVAAKEAYDAANADGKIDWTDLPHVIEPAKALLPAFHGMKLIPAELQDLDFEEAGEIIQAVQDRFGLTDIEAKNLIEHAIKAAYHIKEAVTAAGKVF